MHASILIETILFPFGVTAGDESIPRTNDGISDPVLLSCRFYGVEEDTIYVRLLEYHDNVL